MVAGGGPVTVTRPSEREVRTERVIDAPRGDLWRAFTEPELVARWWGRGHDLTVERFEPTPGGHWRFVEHDSDGDFGFEGRFREMQEPSLISQTFEWDGAPGHVSVTTNEFEELDSSHTRMIQSTMFMTAEDAEAMLGAGMLEGASEGWAALERVLASMPGQAARG
jgi:uncharacterized protein YndB with AHSA1/START domain